MTWALCLQRKRAEQEALCKQALSGRKVMPGVCVCAVVSENPQEAKANVDEVACGVEDGGDDGNSQESNGYATAANRPRGKMSELSELR